jgi:putative alpha-1,2-mannosidase
MTARVRQWMAVAGAAALMGVGAGAAGPRTASAGAAQRTSSALALSHPSGSVLGLPLGATSGGLAALVDPIDGTGVGPENPGNVSEFPGATVPLGMVQFSPDSSPDRAVTTGSGYDYADSRISGFSLTHLSGDGCAIYGDVPILPITGAVPSDPDAAGQPFSHADETAHADTYSVRLGQGAPDQRIGVDLTATTHSALGAFTFPAGGGDDVLFKVSDSADGSSASSARIEGRDRVVGSVTSGNFCGIPGRYTV